MIPYDDRRLATITMSCDFTSGEIELVDVTDDLGKLYDPSEKALESAREIRKVKPVSISQLVDKP